MFRKVFLRDSTEEKTYEKAAGSDGAGPRRKALVIEKSQALLAAAGAPGDPDVGQATRRRGGVQRVGGRGRSSSEGSRGMRSPGFSRTSPRLALSFAAE